MRRDTGKNIVPDSHQQGDDDDWIHRLLEGEGREEDIPILENIAIPENINQYGRDLNLEPENFFRVS